MVCLWGFTSSDPEFDRIKSQAGGDLFASSFREALSIIDQQDSNKSARLLPNNGGAAQGKNVAAVSPAPARATVTPQGV